MTSGVGLPGRVLDAAPPHSKVHVQVLTTPAGEVIGLRPPPTQPPETVLEQSADIAIGQCVKESLKWVEDGLWR